ncbi:MAG: glycosyltransferase family 9 protein, partial [Endomicrobiales bacterium]|nr:glycosyltransferase family 9 protein [Endomicrobiales bacterium]
MKQIPSNPKNILILNIAGMGDAILSTPTLRAIRNRFSNSKISVLILPRTVEIYSGLPFFDRMLVLKNYSYMGKNSIKTLLNVIKLLISLRKENFDLMINIQPVRTFLGSIKMSLLFYLVNAKYKVGRNTFGMGFFYDLRVPEDKTKHEIDVDLQIASSLGADTSNRMPEISISNEDEKTALAFFNDNDIKPNEFTVALNPGAFRPSRRWPAKRWAELGDILINNYRAKVILTGEKKENNLMQTILSSMKNRPVINLGNFNLKQLAALLKNVNLVITNDTGPLHLAVTMNTCVIALFGPGDFNKFYPIGSKNIVLRKDVSCFRPCYKFECDDLKCLKLITIE